MYLYFRNNIHILGDGNSNVPKILSIIGDVISHQALANHPLVLQRLLAIARHIQVCTCAWRAYYSQICV